MVLVVALECVSDVESVEQVVLEGEQTTSGAPRVAELIAMLRVAASAPTGGGPTLVLRQLVLLALPVGVLVVVEVVEIFRNIIF